MSETEKEETVKEPGNQYGQQQVVNTNNIDNDEQDKSKIEVDRGHCVVVKVGMTYWHGLCLMTFVEKGAE